MKITRRSFVSCAAGGLAAAAFGRRAVFAADTPPRFRLSACDWSLGAKGPDALAVARGIGLNGLEVSAGDPADTLAVADPEFRARYKEQVRETGVVVSSVAMGLLNGSPFATEPRGPAWLDQTIEATRDLGAKVILLAFFGKGDLRQKGELKKDDVAAVVSRLKDAAPKAGDAGVILGIENTLSAEQNLDILEQVNSDAVRVYYDVGNSTVNGYDVPAEIRLLKDRICQIHLKDGGFYLGEGKVDMPAAAEAILEIGYKGWLVLETSMPSQDRDADFRRNAEITRQLFKMA